MISIGVYIIFPKITKAVPGSLAAIIVSTIFEWGVIRPAGYETNTGKYRETGKLIMIL